jgi:serine-type D-Ala-D-Ala carboxypeptidase (penicillin-binding protein 5/6)
MTPSCPDRRRRLPLQAAGVVAALLPVIAGVTTAYAGSLGPTPASAVAVAGHAPAAVPTCRPWQTPTTVPPGVVLTPRVFPPASPASASTTGPPTPARSAPPAATTAPRPTKPNKPTKPTKPTVLCRNAPPTPFEHPPWAADSVVGGERLAASGVVTALAPGTPAPPEVYDVSYVIADLDSGEILAAKSPHAWLRPASTLKTLTALTLLPRLDPRTVVVPGEDVQAPAGSRVGILAGNRYTVGNLVDAMLMFSANDAVYALADAAGGYDKTVALMNEEAREIGAYDTLVVDPSGLDEGDQRSSAYDLALIARDAMRLPAFRAVVAKRDAVFPGGKDKQGKEWKPFHIFNINDLLRHYPGAIGVKPGRTDRAQHTFIGAATRGGRTLVVAQMGSVTGSWKPTAALLDWGFANADKVTPVGTLVASGQAAPPRPQPSLTTLPDGSAAATPSAGTTVTGTPAPLDPVVAAASRTGLIADRGSLIAVTVAGALLTTILVGLLVRHRRRRRPPDTAA